MQQQENIINIFQNLLHLMKMSGKQFKNHEN